MMLVKHPFITNRGKENETCEKYRQQLKCRAKEYYDENIRTQCGKVMQRPDRLTYQANIYTGHPSGLSSDSNEEVAEIYNIKGCELILK